MTPSIMMWSMLFDQFEYELAPDCLTNWIQQKLCYANSYRKLVVWISCLVESGVTM
jgi:hypothetical protein